MNSIIWKGVSSTTIQGLLISELPPITKPEMKIKETKIDGRDGSIIEELGYSSYVKTVKIGLHGNFDINQVIKYFTGEGDIVFSNEPDKIYKAKICGKIDYTRLLRYRQASIPFLVQPFKYKLNEYLRETPTETASGTHLEIAKTAEYKPKALKIHGKSMQNGTPTPDAPQEIIPVAKDGNIEISINEQMVSISTNNGMHAIPVTDASVATYIDANGKMWCGDEIDFKRGVYIQRIFEYVCTGNENWTVSTYQPIPNATRYDGVPKNIEATHINNSICTHFAYKAANKLGAWVNGNGTYTQIRIFVENNVIASMEELVAFLKAEYANGTPVTYKCIRSMPIETPLTDEQIELFGALASSEPTITITNDENAYMTVEYFKPFEVFNEGLENSKPLMILKGSGTVEISVNGVGIFSYTFPEGENEVYIDSEKEDAYLGDVLKNRNMNGEFPILMPKTNKIEWSGDIESISILPRSRWL